MTEIERVAYWNGLQWVVSEVRPGTDEKVGLDAYLNSYVWPVRKSPEGARVIEQLLGVPESGAAKTTTKTTAKAANRSREELTRTTRRSHRLSGSRREMNACSARLFIPCS